MAAAAAHWLAGSAGRLAVARQPVWALTVRQLDSAAAGDSGARFPIWFMLVVSCAPGPSLLSRIALISRAACIKKFGKVRLRAFRVMGMNRQTDRQTH